MLDVRRDWSPSLFLPKAEGPIDQYPPLAEFVIAASPVMSMPSTGPLRSCWISFEALISRQTIAFRLRKRREEKGEWLVVGKGRR